MIGLASDNIVCPYCGNNYSTNDSKNVTGTLIYLNQLNDSHSCIRIKDLNYNNYPLLFRRMHTVPESNEDIRYRICYDINKHKECFLLFMCKCPRCHKIYSFVCKVNRSKFNNNNNIKNPFISDIKKKINISPLNILPTRLIFPHYIPSYIVKDYDEAYRIQNISPQSSAILCRKILEEVIVDRFNIPDINKHGHYIPLSKKLNDLNGRKNISSDVMEILYAIKSIGDAGAHKKSHEGQIIRVKHDTAVDLLKLIYDFIKEVYIEKHRKNLIKSKVRETAKSISKKYREHDKSSKN